MKRTFKLIRDNPAKILASYKATTSEGRWLFTSLGLVVATLLLGVWLLFQLWPQNKVFFYQEYVSAYWKGYVQPAFTVGRKDREEITANRFLCDLLTQGNRDGRYDAEIIRYGFVPPLLKGQRTYQQKDIAYAPVLPGGLWRFVLPVGLIGISVITGFMIGAVQDVRYNRAMRGQGVYVDGSVKTDIQTYNKVNGTETSQFGYFLFSRKDGREVMYR